MGGLLTKRSFCEQNLLNRFRSDSRENSLTFCNCSNRFRFTGIVAWKSSEWLVTELQGEDWCWAISEGDLIASTDCEPWKYLHRPRHRGKLHQYGVFRLWKNSAFFTLLVVGYFYFWHFLAFSLIRAKFWIVYTVYWFLQMWKVFCLLSISIATLNVVKLLLPMASYCHEMFFD